MAESMIEKVARAIDQSKDWCRHKDEPESIIAARAAIEAMREPTDAMVDALTSYDSNPESLYDRAIDAALYEQVSG